MKKCIILLIMLLIPINVFGNIVCNDGSVSPSCSDCHRGCCSRHGGCSNSAYVPRDNSTSARSNVNSNSYSGQYNYGSSDSNANYNYSYNYGNANNANSNLNTSNGKSENTNSSWVYYPLALLMLVGFCSDKKKRKRR